MDDQDQTARPIAHDQTPVHRVEELVGPDGRAVLQFGRESYLLRITRNRKLILTK